MEFLAFLLIPLLVFFGVSWFAERLIERYDEDLPEGAMPRSGRLAELILARHWINHVRVDGGSDDFYSPEERRIELSEERVDRASISAAAIAAHEAAHAVQHAERSLPFMVLFHLGVPAFLVSMVWFPLAVAAAVLGSEALAASAFIMFGFTLAVSVVRIFNEIDASRRALRELRELFASEFDQRGVRRVLGVAGATYVADSLFDFGFLGRRLRRNDDDEGGGGGSSGDDADDVAGGLFD